MENLKNIEDTLPNTLHGLLRVAIDDMRSLDRKNYIPKSNKWHLPWFRISWEPGKFNKDCCAICLAGAVIANTLKRKINEDLTPDSFNDTIQRKLSAIESLRIGSIEDAIDFLDSSLFDKIDNDDRWFRVRYYDFQNWEEADLFIKEMEELHSKLKILDI